MDFVNPGVFDKLKMLNEKIMKKTGVDTKGFEVVVLPADSTMYRADKTGKTSPSEGVPNFFSDKESIKPYTGKLGDGAISSYKTNKSLALFVLSYDNICRLASSHPYIELLVTHCYLGKKKDSEGKDEFLYLTPTESLEYGNPRNYVNRKFAEIVCKSGFNGWIAFPNTLKQRNLDPMYNKNNIKLLQEHMSKDEVKYVYKDYAPEIVVCDWSKFMTYSGGSRRRFKMPRKMTRKYCKKTPCKKMGFTQRASCRPWKNCYKNKK